VTRESRGGAPGDPPSPAADLLLRRPDRGARPVARAVVLAAWAVCTASALLYAVRFGGRMPVMDDWEMVPRLTGDSPVSFSWLWAQHNEHRIPLPRLVYLGLVGLTGDFRSGMILSVFLLSGAAAGSIAAMASLRGRVSLADAVFPLAILGLGQHKNLLWCFQLQMVLSAALILAVLATIVRMPLRSDSRTAGLLFALLAAAILCGGVGAAFSPPIVAWLAIAGVARSAGSDPAQRRGGLAMIAAAAGLLALLASVLVGFDRPRVLPASGGLFAAGRTSVQFLGSGLAVAPRSAFSVAAVAVGGAWLATIALLVRAGARGGDRPRALALLAFQLSMGSLALGIGFARSGLGAEAGLESRYATIAMPAICGIAMAWSLHSGSVAGRVASSAILLFLAAAAVPNAREAIDFGTWWRSRMTELDLRVARGASPADLVERFGDDLYPDPAILLRRMEMLRAARMGPFR